jgi:anti-sigma regulatory factor (Ser/Thr protein kinase)
LELSLTSEPRPPAHAALHLEVVNDFASIEEVNRLFNAFAAEHAIPDDTRRTFNIAFDDLINNIVSYGYADDDQHVIVVDVVLTAASLEAAISDDGVAFDPFALATPDLDDELEERRIGGLGIHLVRSMMDEVAYRRDHNLNVVVVRKHLAAGHA